MPMRHSPVRPAGGATTRSATKTAREMTETLYHESQTSLHSDLPGTAAYDAELALALTRCQDQEAHLRELAAQRKHSEMRSALTNGEDLSRQFEVAVLAHAAHAEDGEEIRRWFSQWKRRSAEEREEYRRLVAHDDAASQCSGVSRASVTSRASLAAKRERLRQARELEAVRREKERVDAEFRAQELRLQESELAVEEAALADAEPPTQSGLRLPVSRENTVKMTPLQSAQPEIDALPLLQAFQQRMALPMRTPTVFSGARVEDYLPFRLSFRFSVEANCQDPLERFQYLLQFTSGEAKDLVNSCFSRDAGRAYDHAWRELEERYGDHHHLAAHHMKELRGWPAVKKDDLKGLRALMLYLRRVSNLVDEHAEFSQLDHPVEIRAIVDKLPYALVCRWRERALDLTAAHGRVRLRNLVSFLRRHLEVLTQPVFGVAETQLGDGRAPRRTVLATQEARPVLEVVSERSSPPRTSGAGASRRQVSEVRQVQVRPVQGRGGRAGRPTDGGRRRDEAVHCSFCGDPHSTESCRALQRLPVSSRRSWARREQVCFRCLGRGHRCSECEEDRNCEECGSDRHASLLHPTAAARGTESGAQVASTGGTGKGVLCPAVPVSVRGATGECVAWVAHDTWADTNFVSERLVKRLGLRGSERWTRIVTVRGSGAERVEVLPELELTSLRDGGRHTVREVHVLKDWTLDRRMRGEDEAASRWGRQKVGSDFGRRPEGAVELLIGSCEPSLLTPLEVCAGEPGEPVAVRYQLGWSVSGPITGDTGESSGAVVTLTTDLSEYF